MRQVPFKSASGATIMLFQPEDGDRPGSAMASPTGRDLDVEAGIEKYLQRRISGKGFSPDTAPSPLKRPGGKNGSVGSGSKFADAAAAAAAAGAEEHSGLTSSDESDDGEPDYDLKARGSLKASSDALVEVMKEVANLKLADAAAASKSST